MSIAAADQHGIPHLPPGVAITQPLGERFGEILTPEALEFLAGLHRRRRLIYFAMNALDDLGGVKALLLKATDDLIAHRVF